ncbi:MAG: hypothetical protein JF590_02270, partial [Gemmatimonadetes bacterium]|nr:hypothetical protein [Gemmatimonadota bacterium]
MRHRLALAAFVGTLIASAAGPLAAQDPVPPEAVRVGITYTPGVRPGVVMLPGNGIDSVRAIVGRDLDYSDRFEVVPVPLGQPVPPGPRTVNYQLWLHLGAEYAVDLIPDPIGVLVRVHDLG